MNSRLKREPIIEYKPVIDSLETARAAIVDFAVEIVIKEISFIGSLAINASKILKKP